MTYKRKDVLQEFLDPNSMLTPGVAGTFMMFLVNGLTQPFPELSPRFTALGMAFLLGGVVFYSQKLSGTGIGKKAIYWVVNSLVVFVAGFGAANLAHDATSKRAPEAYMPSLIATAIAQETPKKAARPVKAEDAQALRKQLEQIQAENAKLRDQVKKAEGASGAAGRNTENVFFKRW